MCGRFILRTPPQEIAEHFDLGAVPDLAPRYNVAPTQDVPIVRMARDGRRELVRARWGLVPYGGPGPGRGPLMINARSESAAEKAPFRICLEHRRCLVPADGFYEWKKFDRIRQPYLIDLGGKLFGFAGLWDEWKAEDGARLVSFTILTMDAHATIEPIHHRMPVVVNPSGYSQWLHARDGHLIPSPDTDMLARLRCVPVADFVNSVDNDGPECLTESPEPLELDLFS